MRARGFTLIEVMVALLLMGVFSTMAYRSLDAVLRADAHARAEIERWRGLTLAVGRLENDLYSAVAGIGGRSPGGFQLEGAGAAMAWDRVLSEDEAGGVRRVGYDFAEGTLSRLVWREAAPPGEAASRQSILSGLRSGQFRCLDASGAWQSRWPVAGDETSMPRAVELVLELASGERVRRVLKVR